MADPDGTKQLQPTVTVNGSVAKRDADAIVAEIERTRDDLARTIDSLAARVSPAGNVRRIKDRAVEQMSRPDVRMATAAATLVVVAVAVYRIWGRRKA